MVYRLCDVLIKLTAIAVVFPVILQARLADVLPLVCEHAAAGKRQTVDESQANTIPATAKSGLCCS